MELHPSILNSLTKMLIRFLLISALIVPSAMSAVENQTENPEPLIETVPDGSRV